jgi:thioredoxin reductase (NADPH)
LADGYDVVVAGGGIAGLTAGLVSARFGRSTLVLTGGAPGGLLLSIDKIEGIPGFADGVAGYELCPLAQEQAALSGAEFALAEAEGLEAQGESWRVTAGGSEYLARAVIVATGSRLRALGVPGEERLTGRGVSHCASCDAPLLRDQVVGVVGGGDSALQEALTLAEFASEVIVFHRRQELSSQETYRRRVLEQPKISVRFGTVVEEILGDEKVAAVRTREAATAAVADVELGGVFVYVGLEPNTELLEGGLQLDSAGCVPTDGRLRTELPGVFAAGILRSDSNGQAAGSIGDGTAAAIAADRYLAGGSGSWPEPVLAPVSAGGSYG